MQPVGEVESALRGGEGRHKVRERAHARHGQMMGVAVGDHIRPRAAANVVDRHGDIRDDVHRGLREPREVRLQRARRPARDDVELFEREIDAGGRDGRKVVGEAAGVEKLGRALCGVLAHGAAAVHQRIVVREEQRVEAGVRVCGRRLLVARPRDRRVALRRGRGRHRRQLGLDVAEHARL